MIRAVKLSREFGGSFVVHDVSFHVAAGETFALLGPNGAGKTSALRMLTTLLKPSSGSISIDNLDPTVQSLAVRKRLGVVFQEPSLDMELTVADNLLLHALLYNVPRKTRKAQIRRTLSQFDLWDRRESQVKTLSGGTRRRLEVGRALLHRPKILFLDEPTLGLDPKGRRDFWNHVRALTDAEGITVFLTTHHMEECERVAQRVAILEHGRIVAQGSPSSLLTQTGSRSLEDAFLALTGSVIATSLKSNDLSNRSDIARVAKL